MSEQTLDEEKMAEFYLTDYSVGVGDATLAAVAVLILVLIQSFYPPPIAATTIGFLIISLLYATIIIYAVIIWFIWRYRRDRGRTKGLKLISSMVFLLVPSVLLAYYPTNFLELILWLLTIFCLYVRFGKEPTPLIRYFKAMYNFQGKQGSATKLEVKISVPSQFAIVITTPVVCIAIALHIYPVPFLLVYFCKYILQKKYFSDFSDDVFYKNWKQGERKALHIFIIAGFTWILLSVFASFIFPLQTSFLSKFLFGG
jgi:hypothetical protein